MRRLSIILFTIFLLNFHSFGQKRNEVGEFVKKNSSHSVKIIFKTKPFDAKAHKIKEVGYRTMIDGKLALGTAASIPQTEFESIKFFFDGKLVPVAKSLFSDCYNPNIKKDYIKLKIGDDGKSVMVYMKGSDAAGSYQVFWIFRNDAKHSRFGSGASDADYGSFTTVFFNDDN